MPHEIIAKIRSDMLKTEYDLEMNMLQGALKSFKKTQVLLPFPKAFIKDGEKCYGELQRAVDRAPSPSELFGREGVEYDEDVIEVLCFVHSQRCLKWVENTVPEEGMAFQPQYTFSISFPAGNARRKEFETIAEKYPTKGGYHGSSLGNWHSITKNGLRNFSGTEKQANGALFGEGIYLSKKLRLASDFSVAGDGWGKSELGSTMRIVGVVEWLESPETITASAFTSSDGSKVPEAYVVVPNATHVCITKLYVYSSGVAPQSVLRKKKSPLLTSSGMIVVYLVFLLTVVMLQHENKHTLRWLWRSFKSRAQYLASYF